MNALWLLLVLACPLMMIFMMRGMGGMGSGGHGSSDDHTSDSPRVVQDRDARIAELEREVAELRAAHDAQPDHGEASRR